MDKTNINALVQSFVRSLHLIHENRFNHFKVCLLSLLTFKMVLMTFTLALMKVYFSLLYTE